MKGIIGGILIMLSQTLYCQPSSKVDSLEVYGIVKWKLNRYQDVFHYDFPACEKANAALDTTLQALKASFNAQGQLIEVRTEQRDTLLYLNKVWERRVTNLGTLHRAEKKAERKKGFKTGLLTGSGVGLLLLFLLL